MVNMLQSMSSKARMRDVFVALENTQIIDGANPTSKTPYQHNSIIHKGVDAHVLELDIDMDNSEHCDERFHKAEYIGDESEFQGTEFEISFLTKGPQ
jgi:hypothetical protein